MIAAKGKSVNRGIAIGRVRCLRRSRVVISAAPVADTAAELIRYENACRRAIAQQNTLYCKALAEAGEEVAAVFSIHAMMLEDEEFNDAVRTLITEEKHCAEYAVREAGRRFAAVFAALEDEYLAARSADVLDIARSLVEILTGTDPASMQGDEPAILLADDLAPSETVRLDKSLLLGFVTRGGSVSSHTAILARSMGLPAVVQCAGLQAEWEGHTAILDGSAGCLYVDPSDAMLEAFRDKLAEQEERRARLDALRGQPSVTLDGRAVKLYANIGSLDDITEVEKNDAEGVGLFRSEFIYLGKRSAPSEDDQFAIYKTAAEALAPKRMIVRTCDIGADKTPDYMHLLHEENPALGFRAVRICLTRPDFFKAQLRALLRAARYGNISVMFPMITSAEELRECKALLEECRAELAAEGIAAGEMLVGTMIETPAAVLCADEIAAECDFFSIGTNDLTQYLCALDRQNEQLERFFKPHHPAVLRAIEMTVAAGHRHGIPVHICGELGSDLELTEFFLHIGVDELSVNPASVLPLRKKIRSLDLDGSQKGV